MKKQALTIILALLPLQISHAGQDIKFTNVGVNNVPIDSCMLYTRYIEYNNDGYERIKCSKDAKRQIAQAYCMLMQKQPQYNWIRKAVDWSYNEESINPNTYRFTIRTSRSGAGIVYEKFEFCADCTYKFVTITCHS